MDINFRVLIEPRGFIRIIQLVMSIFAFATTAGFEAASSFLLKCPQFSKEISYKFAYPFRLASSTMRIPEKCLNLTDVTYKTVAFPFDFSSNAEFFVAAGTLTLMFSFGIIVFYVFLHRMYTTNPLAPVVDLLATAVLAIFWLAGSSAWAQGVSDLKYYTSPENFFEEIGICQTDDEPCRSPTAGNFATLNVSLIFGFANFMLWASSIWFIYKETTFFQPIQPPPGGLPPNMGHPQAMQDQDLFGPKVGGPILNNE